MIGALRGLGATADARRVTPGDGVGADAKVGHRQPAVLTTLGVLVAAAFVAVSLLSLVVGPARAARYDLVVTAVGQDRYLAAAIEMVGLGALLFRRQTPTAVMIGETAAVAAVHALGNGNQSPFPLYLVIVATYTLATLGSTGRATFFTAAAGIALVATAKGGGPPVVGVGPVIAQYFFLLTAVVAVGVSVKSRRELLASYRLRAEQAEREQQLIADHAVTGERQRIARDLHDIVAHHVSLLVVQAGAVRESLPADHSSRGVLDSMIRGGRQAMGELRDMLDALRIRHDGAAEAPEPVRPGPGVQQIAELVDRARGAGVNVELQVSGAADTPLTEGTSVAAYRIVQEALTNAAKHAPGTPATVTINYGPSSLALRVANPTAGAATADTVGGHGLIGMRERATLAHGELTAGSRLR